MKRIPKGFQFLKREDVQDNHGLRQMVSLDAVF